MTTASRLAAGAAFLVLTGCEGWQSALDPQGPEARSVAELFWFFAAICGAVWLAVMVALGIAIFRRHAPRPDPMALNPAAERRHVVVVGGAVGLTLAILLVLTGLSFAAQKRIFGSDEHSVALHITGHQWWWEVRYDDPVPARSFTTANEIHLPAGEPVRIRLDSADVIHSFWVPSLTGKMDLITGRETELRFTPQVPGTYRGQCAEFCGWQHAHMGLLVVVEPKAEFDAWREAQLRPAAPPEDEHRRRGEQAFLSGPCVMCHTIRGTPAGGKTGPELTHVGSRSYLAAGTLLRNRGTLAAWVVDPHGIKPGVHMPVVPQPADEVDAIAAYLEGLE
jgi:cytochrome c oxidase subunit II